MPPILYGKSLLSLWRGIKSEVGVHRLVAVMRTMQLFGDASGGFGAAVADFENHRFADDTGANLDGIVGWAVARAKDRAELVRFLGLVFGEAIRRSTKFLDEDQTCRAVYDVVYRTESDASKMPIDSEESARDLFLSFAGEPAVPAGDKLPKSVYEVARMIRDALILFDVFDGVTIDVADDEFGILPKATRDEIFDKWMRLQVQIDDRDDLFAWVETAFGVADGRIAVMWPFAQALRFAKTTRQARTLGSTLSTIFDDGMQELFDAQLEIELARVTKKKSLSDEDLVKMLLSTDDPRVFGGLLIKYAAVPLDYEPGIDNRGSPLYTFLNRYRVTRKYPIWKLRILFKGIVPWMIVDGARVWDVAFSGRKGAYYTRVCKSNPPPLFWRRRIKGFFNKDPELALSNQAWRRLFCQS
jgi:hypothetical protein